MSIVNKQFMGICITIRVDHEDFPDEPPRLEITNNEEGVLDDTFDYNEIMQMADITNEDGSVKEDFGPLGTWEEDPFQLTHIMIEIGKAIKEHIPDED